MLNNYLLFNYFTALYYMQKVMPIGNIGSPKCDVSVAIDILRRRDYFVVAVINDDPVRLRNCARCITGCINCGGDIVVGYRH